MNEGATTLVYKIDDRTGPWVKVQKWITEDQDPANQQERTICQEGMYVKVVGHIKTFNKQMNVTAFHIKPIVDYNEITHHLAEVMFIHLATTRGVPVVSKLNFFQGDCLLFVAIFSLLSFNSKLGRWLLTSMVLPWQRAHRCHQWEEEEEEEEEGCIREACMVELGSSTILD